MNNKIKIRFIVCLVNQKLSNALVHHCHEDVICHEHEDDVFRDLVHVL